MIKLNFQDRQTREQLESDYPYLHDLASGYSNDETDDEVINGFKFMADDGAFVIDASLALLELKRILDVNDIELLQKISFFIFNRGNLGYEHSLNFLTKLSESLDYYEKLRQEFHATTKPEMNKEKPGLLNKLSQIFKKQHDQ